ncbi:unnamed protein product [Pieris brassicae]|uniref:AB hydrolase-1 domain-containing protein n=1 Tax=Pieris brassicae TaxID=7116 RepID=A0A9P0XA73_PIEBR|nr:unnamed protein product [Pieris brassicae]
MDTFSVYTAYSPGLLKPPTLLVHGIELAANSSRLRGNTIVLTKLNHDLWFANVRGNVYSRRHVHLNADIDDEFWDFSFHERGYYDLATTINTVLNKTNSLQINGIGYSLGTIMFTVLTSTRPEYNAKINLTIYLAPIAYLNNVQSSLFNFIFP